LQLGGCRAWSSYRFLVALLPCDKKTFQPSVPCELALGKLPNATS